MRPSILDSAAGSMLAPQSGGYVMYTFRIFKLRRIRRINLRNNTLFNFLVIAHQAIIKYKSDLSTGVVF